MGLQDRVGARLLVFLTPWSRDVTELSVLEASPSGDFVKFRFKSGGQDWYRTRDVTVAERYGESATVASKPSGSAD
jgi:hypothetical protein